MECAVCGDKAYGCNFGAISCESCKSFYRRHAHKQVDFQCPSEGNCTINKFTRKYCPGCRMKKCFRVGMIRPLRDDSANSECVSSARVKKTAKSDKPKEDAFVDSSVSTSHGKRTEVLDTEADHWPAKIRLKHKLKTDEEASPCQSSSSTSSAKDSSPPARTTVDSIRISDTEFVRLQEQIQDAGNFILSPLSGEELGRNDTPPPEIVTRAVVRYMEVALRRIVRGLKRLTDFSSLPHSTQLYVMRRNLMEQFQFASIVHVNDDNTAWVSRTANGHGHENTYDRFVQLGVQFGMNFGPYIESYSRFVADVRSEFPTDWAFLAILFSALTVVSDDPTSVHYAIAAPVRQKYERFLERYLQIQHPHNYEAKLAFCKFAFQRVRRISELNAIVIAQLLTGVPAPPEAGDEESDTLAPARAAATIAPLLAETVLSSLGDSPTS